MTPAIRQMTVAAMLPPVASMEAWARLASLWADGLARMLRAPAAAPARALPPAAPAVAMLAAPEPGAGRDDAMDERGDASDAPQADIEEARDVLAGADPSGEATVAAPDRRAEETGGPTQDAATLVDAATGEGGARQAPDGAVS